MMMMMMMVQKYNYEANRRDFKIQRLYNGIQRVWNFKMNVISIIIGATGVISESFRKRLSNKLGKQDIKELRKTAELGTAQVLREVVT